ncbi:MAG: glycosyl hydrolase family 28-related protein, partial [Dehalococcoidales bacterium]|nr:glycosyl hydrolase family 28-related protein [Dehalococcoidales bacterium]
MKNHLAALCGFFIALMAVLIVPLTIAWPADVEITDLTSLTEPATGDILLVIDVSDTSMDSDGTAKQLTIGDLVSSTKLDDLDSPDDNTDLNASILAHGLLPKLSGAATEYLNGAGAWTTPAGAGDVSGPGSSTDGYIPLWSGTGGDTLAAGIANGSTNWNTAYTHSQVVTGNPHSVTKTDIGLSNVENTALSTWAGSSYITALGIIATGTWQGTAVDDAYLSGTPDFYDDITASTTADNADYILIYDDSESDYRKQTRANFLSASGLGDVTGPASSTDNAIARFDGTGGKTLQNSSVTIDDTGNLTIGTGAAGVDYTLTFNGEDNDITITWLEDEGILNFTGYLRMNGLQEISEFSTDGTMAGNSDTAVPTEKAVKTYVDNNAPGGDDDFHNTLGLSATADNADELLIWDDSASAYARQTRATLLTGVSGVGDMTKAVYDTDDDGHADDAETLTGVLSHELGGLEANVSAYDGLVKITGGTTSAVTVTAAGEAILDDANAGAQRTTLGLGDVSTLTKQTTITDSDSYVPTSGAVVDYVKKGLVYDVTAYGATPDSSPYNTDDDAETIQDAIDAAFAVGGGIVFIPEGDYYVAETIIMKPNVYIYGAGRTTTRLERTGDYTTGSYNDTFRAHYWTSATAQTSVSNCGLAGFTIRVETSATDGSDAMTSGAHIWIDIPQNVHLRDLDIYDGYNNIYAKGGDKLYIENINTYYTVPGTTVLYQDSDGNRANSSVTFTLGQVQRDEGSATSDPPNNTDGYLYDSAASFTNDEWNTYWVVMTSGTASGNWYYIYDTVASNSYLVCREYADGGTSTVNLYSDGVRSGDSYKIITASLPSLYIMNGCSIRGGYSSTTLTENSFHITSSDGVWINNTHVANGNNANLYFCPNSVGWDRLDGVYVTNLWSDGPGDGVTGIEFDQPSNAAIHLYGSIKFANTYIGYGTSSSVDGIHFTSTCSYLNDVLFTNTIINAVGEHGVNIDAGKNIRFDGGNIQGCNQSDGTFNGIDIAAGVSYFTINNMQIGHFYIPRTSSTLTAKTKYGINIASGASNYFTITNNRLSGNTTGPLLDKSTGTYKNISGNIPNSLGYGSYAIDFEVIDGANHAWIGVNGNSADNYSAGVMLGSGGTVYSRYHVMPGSSGTTHRAYFDITDTLYFRKLSDSSTLMSLTNGGNLSISGALSKGSGTFKITHPLNEGKWLYHSFIEGPKADLIYRGKVTLVDGKAAVDLDAASNMTPGT